MPVLRHSDKLNVVQKREEELTIDQIALYCLQCWMLPEHEQKRHHGISSFAVKNALRCDPRHEDPALWHDMKLYRVWCEFCDPLQRMCDRAH